MCKQDIAIGRKLVSRQVAVTPGAGAVATGLAPRADRLGISVSVGQFDPATATDFAFAGPRFGAGAFPTVWFNIENPSRYLSVADYGPVVTEELIVRDGTAAGVTFYITEYYINETLEAV